MQVAARAYTSTFANFFCFFNSLDPFPIYRYNVRKATRTSHEMHGFLKPLTIVATLLASTIVVSSTPTSVVAASDGPTNTTRVLPFSGPATTYAYKASGEKLGMVTTDLATFKALEPELDNSIVVKGFSTAVAVTAVTCATGQPPPVCIAGAVAAVFTIFFSIFEASGKRDTPSYVLLTDYPPNIGCGTICRLGSEAPEGGWRPIGNYTANGVFHSLHYKRNGTLSGIRAVEHGSPNPNGKRAEDNDGGVVVDYHWDADQVQAYDSFDSNPTSTADFADDVVDSLFDDDDILSCANFEDSDGILAPGLISVGWNNQPFQFASGDEEGALLEECEDV
ncbi:hypothetical protein K439DRAFT_1063437 [Ramaria rubella]|nr:hypothetical protein K439DRAFT_1063437 [Ramaria rubella]